MNNGIISFLPMILVFIVFYFVLIRPQQAKQRELKAALNALRRGDRVKTSGGLIGTIQLAREGSDEVEVEIAPGVKVLVARDGIATVLSSSGKVTAEAAKSK